MLKWTIDILSIRQILIGINYHRGTEVFPQDGEKDLKLDFHELQIGLLFIVIEFTLYVGERGD